MAWTNTQKQLAIRACRAAGISEEQRVDMILRNFKNAHHAGRITSTSPKLSCADYEQFMAVIERFAGGKLLHFSEWYWRDCADRWLDRLRRRVLILSGELERSGKLAACGVGLAGWIEKRVSAGATRKITDLDFHGLQALLLGLQAYARQSALPVAS